MATSSLRHVTLTGKQWQELQGALLLGFPNYDALSMFVQFEMDIALPPVTDTGSLGTDVFNLIGHLQAMNRLPELVEAAQRSRPSTPDFIKIARELGVFPEVYELGEESVEVDDDQLEKILSTENIMFDAAEFRRRLAVIEGQVCRVEVNGQARGTGFLIGPSAAITNYHVVKDVLENKANDSHERITLRFDHKLLDDRTTINSGTLYKLRSNWLIDSSPYSAVDLKPEPKSAEPSLEELDYAILRAEGRPAEDLLTRTPGLQNASQRGYIELPKSKQANPKYVNRVMFVVQHPRGHPMKVTVNTLQGENSNRTRITYINDTDNGSSGSPCFDGNWNLIALHHSGDPDFRQPKYNQGIPIHAIRRLLSKRRKLKALLE